jgi:AcrR family transcriptional regulator
MPSSEAAPVNVVNPQGRRAQKAERTRAKLLEATREQMSAGGPESITIQSITATADIGLGTFYNYFESRDEVIDAVIVEAVESLGQRLDALTRDMEDPAEIYAFSLRHLMRTAVTDPVWGWLAVRLGIAQEGLLSSLGPRASRDLRLGVTAGRFRIENIAVASAMTFGSLLAVMHDYLAGVITTDPSSDYAENLLCMVGVTPDEAHAIAHKPLPELPEVP